MDDQGFQELCSQPRLAPRAGVESGRGVAAPILLDTMPLEPVIFYNETRLFPQHQPLGHRKSVS